MQKDWWKWGDLKEAQFIGDYPKLKSDVESLWGVNLKEDFYPPEKFDLPAVSEKLQNTIRDIFGSISSNNISFSEEDRLSVSLGKSYYDVIRIFKDPNITCPDVVIRPETHQDIQYILNQAHQNDIYIIPYGGGTNVVGALSLDGLEDSPEIKCTLDLRNYNNLIRIDEENLLATFEAGILGPKLEAELNKRGYTLGHFPQSFEFSTLGGWVVTRSAGQESTYYGKIENLVERIKVATPTGTIQSNTFSHDASGVNILPFFIGSEGTLGVVSEVTVRIQKKPKKFHWVVALFPTFEKGTAFLKELVQSGVRPSVARLSDVSETLFYSKLSKPKETGTLGKIKNEVQEAFLKFKNLSEPSALLLRFPESAYSNYSEVLFAQRLVKKHDGFVAPSSFSSDWEKNRFKHPYLRDTMVQHSIFVDTMETLVRWQDVPRLHQGLTQALKESDAFHRERGILLTHISHIYPNAASMYFMLFAPMKKDRELEQWKEIKELVTNTIVKYNGAVSHHHSVGSDHQKWYLEQTDKTALEMLKALKKTIDPKGIMNPGKLFSGLQK